MAYPLINGAAINENSGATQSSGIKLVTAGQPQAVFALEALESYPLKLGPLRAKVGFDVTLVIPGLQLVRTEWHSAIPSMLPGHAEGAVASAFPLRLGTPSARAGAVTAQVPAHVVLHMGSPFARPAAFAGGAQPLVVRAPAAVRVGVGRAHQPLKLGTPSAAASIFVPGLRLVRAGIPSAVVQATDVVAGGYYPLRLGVPAAARIGYAGQAVALRLGAPRIDRGMAC